MIPLATAEALAREARPPDWRMTARGAFWRCRDATQVRDTFRAVSRAAEGANPEQLAALWQEFVAALNRFKQEVQA